MKQRLKGSLLAMLLLLTMVLSGCSGLPDLVFSPQDLYRLPELPAKYTELNGRLNALLAEGAEYAAPLSGTNIQSVQLVDLDGDAHQEALAFLRNTADEKPLKIHIFTAEGDGYAQTGLIEANGTSIYSVAYSDLDGDGRMELLVGWKATAELQVLEVYTQRHGTLEVLLSTDYVKYTITDLDRDGRQELVILRVDEEGGGIADYYRWQEGGELTKQFSPRISATMMELSQQGRLTRGTLSDGAPAVFVTGVSDMAMTDVLTLRDGELTNIMLSESTGVTKVIAPFSGLYPMDIDGDGMTEVPAPVQLPMLTETGPVTQRVDWIRYNSLGKEETALRTYHDTENGWYLRLPEEWNDRLYVSRGETSGESYVTFFIWNNDLEPKPFLRITVLTGTSREIRATRGERFVLSRQTAAIYTAELLEANEEWKYGMTADQVREAFSLIATEWAAGDN